MRQLCKRIETECLAGQDDDKEQTGTGTGKDADKESGTNKKAGGQRKHLKHVDVDKLIRLCLDEYDHQAELEKERVRLQLHHRHLNFANCRSAR